MHGQRLWKAAAYTVCSEALPSISQLSVRSCTESIQEYKEQLGGEQQGNPKLRKMPHTLLGWELESGRHKQED